MNRYEPPYDSPIEQILAWHLTRYLEWDVEFDKQVEIHTRHGLFRADFVLSHMGEKIEVECDGRDFHDQSRDELRDAIVLGEGHVDTIYRFRGCDITYNPADCVWLMSVLDPSLFSQRGHLHLDRLRKLEIPEGYEWGGQESYVFMPDRGGHGRLFWAFRRSVHGKPDLRYFWKHLYSFACNHAGTGLDELMNIKESTW
ncbi:MAG: hypothetical protein ACE5JL_17600 [Dehalococcoidia bacterium]